MSTMHMTFRDIAGELDPPITERQLAVLAAIANITPTGVRRTGNRGRPAYTYDPAHVKNAHAEESARTAKQFTDNDWIAHALLARDLISADAAAGELRWPDGSRAETLHPDLYGWVHVGTQRCPAHRVIWISGDGEIPPAIQVNHINQLRWDNRRANLELVTFGNNIRHAHGTPYINYHDAVSQLATLPPPDEMPATAESLVRAGGAFRHIGK